MEEERTSPNCAKCGCSTPTLIFKWVLLAFFTFLIVLLCYYLYRVFVLGDAVEALLE